MRGDSLSKTAAGAAAAAAAAAAVIIARMSVRARGFAFVGRSVMVLGEPDEWS